MNNKLNWLLFSLIPISLGQNLCDDNYGLYCPEESGWDVGNCLKKRINEDIITKECQSFISLHDACKDDIDLHCNGKEYTGDLLPCLTEWINPEIISEQCKELFPPKAEKKDKSKQTKEQKKKADARRKKREKAAKIAREF